MPPSPFEQSKEDRTEPATPFRREEFRKQGKVALSRELVSVLLLMIVGGVLFLSGEAIFNQFAIFTEKVFKFDKVGELGKPEVLTLRMAMAKTWGWMVFPAFAAAIVGGLLVCAAQVGVYVTFQPMSPNLDRINPISGLQRLFSSKRLIEAPKVFLKLIIAAIVVWVFIKKLIPTAGYYYQKNVGEIVAIQFTTVAKLFYILLAVMAFLAILDYAFQKYQLEKEMKMTRREAKDEFKMREGDPLIKSRIKTIQRRIATRRMMEDVPKSDVVVTNPRHLAVALKYDQESMVAPKVVAKGAGIVAQKIKEVARFNRVPIVENKPLARTLFKQIEIGKYIPRELYKAVAEVLAYVYRLRGVNQMAAA